MKLYKMLAGTCILLLVASSIGFAETYHTVKITASKLNVREGMTIEAPIVGTLNQEAKVTTLELKDGWYKISYSGAPAYISADYAQVVGDSIKGYIKGQHVNMRDTASLEDSKVISQLSNVEVEVHAKQGDWYSITSLDGKSGYVFANFVDFETSTPQKENTKTSSEEIVTSRGDNSNDMVAIAKSKLGCPYVWAGEGPDNFDCSGFAKYCFKEAYGIILPHSASAISKMGTTIPKDQLMPGDFVFFTTNRSGNVNHVGIYIGNGEFIHASSSSSNAHQVHINPINTGFYDEVYKWAKRIDTE